MPGKERGFLVGHGQRLTDLLHQQELSLQNHVGQERESYLLQVNEADLFDSWLKSTQ